MQGLLFWLALAIGALLVSAVLWTAGRVLAFHLRISRLPSEAELLGRLAALAERQPANPWQRQPPGLVLSGGGGKGAYQIGCWRALRLAGVTRFSAIAGTSVGALNAILVTVDDLDAAGDLWDGISLGKVLQFNGWKAVAARLPLLPYYAIRHSSFFSGRRRPTLWQAAKMAREVNLDHGVFGLGELIALVKQFPRQFGKWVGWLVTLVLLIPLVALLQLMPAPEPQPWMPPPMPGSTPLQPGELFRLAWQLLLLSGSLSLWLLIVWSWWLRRDVALARTRPVASDEPLRETLRAAFDARRLRAAATPVFVTTACLRRVELPPAKPRATPRATPRGNPAPPPPRREARSRRSPPRHAPGKSEGRLRAWWRKNVWAGDDFGRPIDPDFGTQIESAGPAAVALPVERLRSIEYVPRYTDLRQLDEAEIEQYVLQSAGLPEIFARRLVDGEEWVDGGVADNTPVLPLLQLEIRDLIVVHLSSRARSLDLLARARRLEHYLSTASRLTDSDPRSEQAGASPLSAVAPGEVRVLDIVPSAPLGGLLTGTLNFRTRRARALMKLGLADTLAALEAGPSTRSLPPPAGLTTE